MGLCRVRNRKQGPGVRLSLSLSLGERLGERQSPMLEQGCKGDAKESGGLQNDYATEQFVTWTMAGGP